MEAHPDRDFAGLVFAALADARRRELLELLARRPGLSAGALAALLQGTAAGDTTPARAA